MGKEKEIGADVVVLKLELFKKNKNIESLTIKHLLMKRKIFYVTALICCMSLFSSARQMAIGTSVDTKKQTTKVCKKKAVKARPGLCRGQRPFNFFLTNI